MGAEVRLAVAEGLGAGATLTLGEGDGALVRFLTVVVGSSHATETTAAITSTAVVITRLFACKVTEAPPLGIIPGSRDFTPSGPERRP